MKESEMQQRELGSEGLAVSALGLGCMGMSGFYGSADEREAIATIHRAIELGVTFFDTAEQYGPFSNEELVGRAIAGRRDELQIATKFGVVVDPDDPAKRRLDGSRGNVRRSVEGSLKRLRTDHIDLYFQHRIDPSTPPEETVGALGELVAEGKVRYIGLSEAAPRTIRRAHAVHPLTAVQTEYSLWTRHVEDEILPTLRELGIGLVAYAPLGRGFLGGRFKSPEELDENDVRRHGPRFTGENLEHNLGLAAKVAEIAAEKGATPAQFALAWVLARGEDVVPIPGTSRRENLEQNLGALEVDLDADDLARVDAEVPAASGERYDEQQMRRIDV
jgi:aryl-alcohol dehydrogenase-like predicted oxidoreductase